MNVRTITIVLIALPVVSIIGNAVVVRELAPRLANSSGSAAGAADARATTEQSAPHSGRGRTVGTPHSGRDQAAVRQLIRRPVSSGPRLSPLAQTDDTRWRWQQKLRRN